MNKLIHLLLGTSVVLAPLASYALPAKTYSSEAAATATVERLLTVNKVSDLIFPTIYGVPAGSLGGGTINFGQNIADPNEFQINGVMVEGGPSGGSGTMTGQNAHWALTGPAGIAYQVKTDVDHLTSADGQSTMELELNVFSSTTGEVNNYRFGGTGADDLWTRGELSVPGEVVAGDYTGSVRILVNL